MRRHPTPRALDEVVRRQDLTRRRVLQGMLATAGAAAAGTGLSTWVTQGSARAAGALLAPGTRPDPTRPEGADTIPQIEHVVIYMQENHSYDQYLGMHPRGDGFSIGADGKPTNWNPDLNGDPFTVYHAESTCDPVISGNHSWNAEHRSVNGGAMDGFIRASGTTNVLGYYDRSNLPFYWGLADTFPVCDRWFCSVRGPTYPNRRFLQAATSVGIVATDTNEVIATPTAPNGTIWERLDAHGISWKCYAVDIGDIWLFPTTDITSFAAATLDNRAKFPDFLADCRNGTLPAVSIISPGTHDQYDEGSRDVQNGEAYSYSIINAVLASPQWHRTALFFMYDENGGGYDHVPPPPGVAPDAIAPRIHVPPDEPGDFTDLGPRVPAYVISPYAKRDYVSHVVHDHTSVLKFIETKWNLGAMTYRDANADDLLDCFDFARPGFWDPPILPAPGLPAGGSVCQPQDRPATNPLPTTTTTTTSTSTSTTSTTVDAAGNAANAAGQSGAAGAATTAATPASAVTATPALAG